MAEPWIQESKLVPPAPPAGWLARPGLATEAPVVALVGGPGHGKTLALLELVAPVRAAGGPVAWYALDAYDADPQTFFAHLAASVERAIPGFAGPMHQALAAGETEPKPLWQRFFRTLAAFNAPAVAIALDDAHALLDSDEGEAILQGLVPFLDKLPPRVRVLVASRRPLPLPTGRLAAAGKLTAHGPEALRFTAEEADAFLAARAPAGRVPDAWRAAAARLEGWPLGLAMVATGGAAPGVGGAAMVAYVAEELYQAQPRALRAFMLRAALLEDLEPTILEATGAADAETSLAQLTDAQLLQRLADGGGHRFPAYLRDFLLAEAARALSAEERASLHAAAARAYAAAGRPERAVPHAFAAGDWDAALALGREAFPALLAAGRQAMIARWLDALPPAMAEAPALLLWRGIVANQRGEAADAKPLYERARAGFGAIDDRAGELEATVRLASLAVVTGDMKAYGRLWAQAQASLDAGGPEDVADLNLIRSLAAERRGDMALMRECNEAVLGIPVAGNVEVATCRAIALLNLFTLHFHSGDLRAARGAIADLLTISAAWGFGPFTTLAAILRAHLDVTTGDLEAAGRFLRGLPPGFLDALDWHDRGVAGVVLGSYHLATADREAADDALHRAQREFQRADFAEGEKLARERLVWLAILRGKPARAIALAGQEAEAPGANVYDLALAVARARALHLDARSAEALAAFDTLLPDLADQGFGLHLARARYYRAAALRTLGDPAWREALVEADAGAEAAGYGFLRGQDQLLWEELAPEPAQAAPEAPAPTAEALEIKLFGPFEARRGGVLLDQWPRKKAKLMLASLGLYPRGLDVAELADLWGEAEATKQLHVTMRVNVLALRRVLEPQLEKGEGSRYVAFEHDRYRLVAEGLAAVDVQGFEAAIARAERLRRADPLGACAPYAEALALYRGNLLEDPGFAGYFEAERARCRHQALEGLFHLALHGPAAETEARLARAVALAPAEEEAHERLIRHLLAGGEIERARRAYWDCRRALQAHLGLAPSDELDTLYRALPPMHEDPARSRAARRGT